MSYPAKIVNALLGAALAFCLPACVSAQESATPADAGEISGTLRTVAYPEIMYPNERIPEWDRGYMIHHEIEENFSPDTPMVTMWNATGKHIRDGRIWPPAAGSVRIRRVAATREGAILAAGWAILRDGSIQRYIVKTDLAGNTVQTLMTGSSGTAQMCEAQDGTIWSLGTTVSQENGQENNTNVLRHYSFEKGLLHSYLPLVTVEAVVPLRSKRPWFEPFETSVRCGKEKVFVYLSFTDEYAEVDTSSFELKRWKLDMTALPREKARGLAVTEDGRVYASFGPSWMGGNIRGLYQIKAEAGNPIARLLPVEGTIKALERGKAPPPGTIEWLWGADGNQLVLWRDHEPDGSWVSWVNVIHN
jgi:hypothetical protein